MKIWYFSLAVFMTAGAHGLQDNEKRAVEYAQAQLQKAFTLLLDLNRTIDSLEKKEAVTHRIAEITTERQALRLLHIYHSQSQQDHLERLIELYNMQSRHPLLQAALTLQKELS
ncbi:MAG TPA: hypothetical protein VI521_00565 [Candidatus Babeliales bacterium]|nr:hypothetical protein [Candidatus Babeliales bacterium]